MIRLSLLFFIALSAFHLQAQSVWIRTGADAVPLLQKELGLLPVQTSEDIRKQVAIFEIDASQVEAISHLMHDHFLRCGGFFRHGSLAQALTAERQANRPIRRKALPAYNIDRAHQIGVLTPNLQESRIVDVIASLEQFGSRYAELPSGTQAIEWIADTWRSFAVHRPEITVEVVPHPNLPQPSVIATIPGSRFPDEIVVLGGHADSITQFVNDAPGADDNASGIATLTEVLRVALAHGYLPERTVKFMGYGLEEIGLIGSSLIAQDHKVKGVQVYGVMQLDMTNWRENSEQIALTDDFTDPTLTAFTEQLIDRYLGIPRTRISCGYACSDHASWTEAGYPAVYPFEGTRANPQIHTRRETLSNMDFRADHALKFSVLATAFMLELAKGELAPQPARQLLYPWVSNRDGQFRSTLIVNNYGSHPLQVNLTARRQDGSSQTVNRQIPAMGFLQEEASNLFSELGSGAGYSVILQSDQPHVAGSWITANLTTQSGASPSQGVAITIPAGADQTALAASRIIFPFLPVSEGYLSSVALVNLDAQPATLTLQAFDQAGRTLHTQILPDVAPFVPTPILINDLLDSNRDIYLTVSSDRGPISGVSFSFDATFKEPAIGNAVSNRSDDPNYTRRLLYPWVSNSESFESIIAATNRADATQTITLTAYRQTDPPQTLTRTLQPGVMLRESASSLFSQLGSGAGYSVRVDAPSGQISGQWLTNNLHAASGRSPSQGMAIDLTHHTGHALLFSRLPRSGAFLSAPVIVNTGQKPAEVELSFYNQQGQLVHRDTNTLTALQQWRPYAQTLDQMLPAGSENLQLIARAKGSSIAGLSFVFDQTFLEPAIGNAIPIPHNKN